MTEGTWRDHLAAAPDRWWREGVLYQVYPRSFADSGNDGVGDLPGLVDRLDYLSWLGVDGIWLSPTMPSPNRDWGYDVADYCDVHPDLGTLADLDRLIAAAHERGIRLLLDLVPNHTSYEHPWFRDARSSRASRHRDWYVWADPGPDGGPPNNWRSVFGGSAWEFDPLTGQYYLHNFEVGQPDLNWWNPEVRRAFEGILRFWFERGVDGFRIDVAHGIVKDRELRDDPPATEDDPPHFQRLGLRQVYSANRPETHDILRSWRRLVDVLRPPRLLVGESYVLDIPSLASFYGTGDELHLAFNFPFVFAPLDGASHRRVVANVEAGLPAGAWPVYTGSNHDVGRFATRWCHGDERGARCALLMLLTLRGTPFLYYGDEIGMVDVPIPPERILDPAARDGSPTRDACRTPMQWSPEPGAGFTAPGVEPWLPIGDYQARSVAGQRDQPGSTLTLVRDLVALRRSLPELRCGEYVELPAPDGVWAWRRGASVTVAINFSDQERRLPRVAGRIRITTTREREGDEVGGELRLGPCEGVIIS
jgi:alpha-glucosidase